jgi:cytoskeleton protein RodZ
LLEQRQTLGLSLDDVVRRTRIQLHFLEAIESDDFQQLPGIVFARNFVRQYAAALGLDPEPLLEKLPKLDQSTVPLPTAPAKSRSRRSHRSRQRWASAALALLTVIAVSAAWIYYNQGWRILFAVERRPQAEATVKAESFPNTEPASSPEPAPMLEAAAVPDPEPADAPPSEAPKPQNPVQVVVTARESAWVSVTADSKSAYIGTLKRNESREISAAEQVKIVTGNAGALTISLNGKILDPLGPSGQIRTVRLTAEGPEFPSKAPTAPASVAADPL